MEPEKASISRKRKVILNSGQYKASREHKNPNAKTSVWDRIKEFPGHLKCILGPMLARRHSLRKRALLRNMHVKSKKYLNGISSIAKNKKESQTFLQCLHKQENRDHASGSTVPSDKRLFRFEVVESLLLAGIPISKVDILRPLFEQYAQRLTSSSHMNDLIPAVLEKKRKRH